MSWKFDPFIPPHPPTSPEVGFFTPIYPLHPLRRGGAMWASPPTRIIKLQQDGASRTPPPTKFYHSSVRRGRRPCPPAKFVPSSMQKTLSLRGRSAPVAIRNPRPLLHAKKEDASRHPLFSQLNRWRITSARPWRRLPPAPSSCSLRRPWTGLPSEWWESPQQPSWPQPGPGR